jgi:hypothetical protein
LVAALLQITRRIANGISTIFRNGSHAFLPELRRMLDAAVTAPGTGCADYRRIMSSTLSRPERSRRAPAGQPRSDQK